MAGGRQPTRLTALLVFLILILVIPSGAHQENTGTNRRNVIRLSGFGLDRPTQADDSLRARSTRPCRRLSGSHRRGGKPAQPTLGTRADEMRHSRAQPSRRRQVSAIHQQRYDGGLRPRPVPHGLFGSALVGARGAHLRKSKRLSPHPTPAAHRPNCS